MAWLNFNLEQKFRELNSVAKCCQAVAHHEHFVEAAKWTFVTRKGQVIKVE